MQNALPRSRQWWLPGGILLFALLLSGCATQTHSLLQSRPADIPARQELAATPFFPQEKYQCGPAALATVLQASDIEVSPQELISQVYVPERKGSLQSEMLAAARRNGALAMTIPPQMDALLREVASGNPVVVMQNLSLPIYPMWHYAVVIGYDLDREEVVLRSGTYRRLVMPLSTFEHTWGRSNRWAMTALPPTRLPATARLGDALPALVAFEKVSVPERARAAYQAALQRWPDQPLLHVGLGNSAYAAGDLPSAAAAFRKAAEIDPGNAAALNNLATVLAELGEYDAARVAAEQALALGGQWSDTARATLEAVSRKSAAN